MTLLPQKEGKSGQSRGKERKRALGEMGTQKEEGAFSSQAKCLLLPECPERTLMALFSEDERMTKVSIHVCMIEVFEVIH